MDEAASDNMGTEFETETAAPHDQVCGLFAKALDPIAGIDIRRDRIKHVEVLKNGRAC